MGWAWFTARSTCTSGVIMPSVQSRSETIVGQPHPIDSQTVRGELSEEVKPVRDAAGQIDIQGTTQAVTSVVEGWIREYPDQWLWLHRRWR